MNTESITYQAILDAPDVTIGYQNKKGTITIAEHLNLHIFEGEMVCLLGPNGCGKSTLIRTLAGMQAPLNGKIFIQNEEIKHKHTETLAKKMSVVLTERVDLVNIQVFEMVALGRYPYTNWFGKLDDEDTKRVIESLEQVDLLDYKDRYLHTLSDGEKQRVMIAKALAQDTPFIMLDEPTAHLDLPNRIEIMKLLKELAHTTSRSILLSTHELDLALQVSDRIWLMQKNKGIICGTPEDLVLNGSFEQAFKKQSFDFDKTNGLFKIAYDYKYTVSVTGDKTWCFWTQRALERHGCRVSTEGNVLAQVEVSENLWKVNYANKNVNCNSIFELLVALSEIKK